MPRTGRGGRRTGTPGRAYGNRTDLPGSSPATQQVGGGTAAINPQNVQPLAGPEQVPGVPGAPSAPGGGPQMPDMALPEGAVPPGQLTPLTAPGSGQPITSGAPVGPGPGMESLGAFAPGQPTQDMFALAKYLPALEMLQSLPNLSQKTRTLIRMLRASVPLEVRDLGLGHVPPEQRGQ